MHSESDLRDELNGAAPTTSSRIDPDAVIRRAKARRVPRQVAFGSAAVLAVAGFAVLGTSTLPSLFSMSTGASDSAIVAGAGSQVSELKGDHFGDAQPGANRQIAGRCGSASIGAAPNSWGLVLTTSFPATAQANGLPVSGTVTLTNTGATRVTGTTSTTPVISLVRDGITVWHTGGAADGPGRSIALDSGQSVTFSASYTPVECTVDDESADVFPEDLPPLGPGAVDVMAAINFVPDASDASDAPDAGAEVVVSGPAHAVTLR